MTATMTSGERAGIAWGFACVALGGLVAAVTGPLELEKGSWLAAYLVLVAGLAQIVLAGQRQYFDAVAAGTTGFHLRVTLWAGGSLLVMAGSLAHAPFVVDAGGAALVVALAAALWNVRSARRRGLAQLAGAFYAVLLVSIPVGLVLAHLRA